MEYEESVGQHVFQVISSDFEADASNLKKTTFLS